jgi:hypothetical protein
MQLISTAQMKRLFKAEISESKSISHPHHCAPRLALPRITSPRLASPFLSAPNFAHRTGKLGRLLDVGAGCGRITSAMAPVFDEVVATEVGMFLSRILPKFIHASSHVNAGRADDDQPPPGPWFHGYSDRRPGAYPPLLEVARLRLFSLFVCHSNTPQEKDLAGELFDCVALLNVIDRCDQPVTLLRQVRKLLRTTSSWYLRVRPLSIRRTHAYTRAHHLGWCWRPHCRCGLLWRRVTVRRLP